jgi:hypothetical protein
MTARFRRPQRKGEWQRRMTSSPPVGRTSI